MEVDGEMPKKKVLNTPKRNVIRVESEEEEAEEIAFVPSALGESRGPIYFCDNRCSEAVKYWQIASVVVEEGGEAHTINLCLQCYIEQMVQQGTQPLKLWQWKEVVEKMAHRGRLSKVFGSEQFLRHS